MKKKAKKKTTVWKCLICGVNYFDKKLYPAEEMASTCMWIHIFRKDKHLKKLMRVLD